MRMNEFQAAIVRSEPISGFIDDEIATAINKSVGDMLVAAARLAQSAGTDLDSIAYEAAKRVAVVVAPSPASGPATGMGNQSEPS